MAPLLCLAVALGLLDHALGPRGIREGRGRWAAAGALFLALGVYALPRGYLLGKVIAHLLMPAGLLWLALTMVVIWSKRAAPPLLALTTAVVWAAYTAAGCPAVGQLGIRVLESEARSIDPFETPPFDAVVVLGGGTSWVDGPRLSHAGDRVVLGAQLYLMGRTSRLVATGSSIPGWGPRRDLTKETLAVWTSLGVPPSAVLRLPEPKNTREEIAAVAELVEREGFRRVGLVTSAWHLPRAMALVREAGLQVTPLAADYRGRAGFGFWGAPTIDFIPSGEGFETVHRVGWEFLGRAVGR
ncbi:MAG: YdcF family protein [Myxococcota bacterium]